MLAFVTLFIFLRNIYATNIACPVRDIKQILEGCSQLKGMNITTCGGTVINDHNCDVLLPKQVFTEEPGFYYMLAENNKFYTILLVDADFHSQEGDFYLHLLKSNVPGIAMKLAQHSIDAGVEYKNYMPLSPGKDSKPHRYIGLLYEQQERNNFVATVPQRTHFQLVDWTKGHRLCGPVAATQFRSQF